MLQQDLDNILITIGNLAKILKVHPRTLRIYEKENILTPKRSIGNRRLYSVSDIKRAKLILFLTRNLALNLSGVKIILEIFKKIEIKPEYYSDFISDIAKSAAIKQEENILKTLKKGRKQKTAIS